MLQPVREEACPSSGAVLSQTQALHLSFPNANRERSTVLSGLVFLGAGARLGVLVLEPGSWRVLEYEGQEYGPEHKANGMKFSHSPQLLLPEITLPGPFRLVHPPCRKPLSPPFAP